MTSRRNKKAAREAEHRRMMTALIAFLDAHWPLWRQHEGEPRHHDLSAAFIAGWKAL